METEMNTDFDARNRSSGALSIASGSRCSGFLQIQFVKRDALRLIAISIDLNDGRRNLKE
jgi:hypothetical protein